MLLQVGIQYNGHHKPEKCALFQGKLRQYIRAVCIFRPSYCIIFYEKNLLFDYNQKSLRQHKKNPSSGYSCMSFLRYFSYESKDYRFFSHQPARIATISTYTILLAAAYFVLQTDPMLSNDETMTMADLVLLTRKRKVQCCELYGATGMMQTSLSV